jgi:hypothetical protein
MGRPWRLGGDGGAAGVGKDGGGAERAQRDGFVLLPHIGVAREGQNAQAHLLCHTGINTLPRSPELRPPSPRWTLELPSC